MSSGLYMLIELKEYAEPVGEYDPFIVHLYNLENSKPYRDLFKLLNGYKMRNMPGGQEMYHISTDDLLELLTVNTLDINIVKRLKEILQDWQNTKYKEYYVQFILD